MTTKNFETGYPFDSFDSFYNLVRRRRSGRYEVNFKHIPNIPILLYYALLSGIKISKLAYIKWEDIYDPNSDRSIKTKKRFNFCGTDISIKLSSETYYLVCTKYNGNKCKLTDYVLKYNDGSNFDPKHLTRDIRLWLKLVDYPYYEQFISESTQIMFGRRVLQVHGYDKEILQGLKKHLKKRSVNELMEFLHISHKEEEPQREIFEGLYNKL